MTFPEYTTAERRADGAIHWIGMTLALAAAAALFWRTAETGDALRIVAGAAYGTGLLAMIGFSAAYNMISGPCWKERVRRCDRTAIYLMIAGTYTPFALIGLGGGTGMALLGAVWAVALAGMALAWFRPRRFERASLALYIALGWIGLPALGLLAAALPGTTLALLGAGGAIYTIGVVFHLWQRLPGNNAVWHGLVLVAAACHYLAVMQTLAE